MPNQSAKNDQKGTSDNDLRQLIWSNTLFFWEIGSTALLPEAVWEYCLPAGK